jgi:hypothetical protein
MPQYYPSSAVQNIINPLESLLLTLSFFPVRTEHQGKQIFTKQTRSDRIHRRQGQQGTQAHVLGTHH